MTDEVRAWQSKVRRLFEHDLRMSTRQAAELLGVTQSTYRGWTNDNSTPPSVKVMALIAEHTGFSVAEQAAVLGVSVPTIVEYAPLNDPERRPSASEMGDAVMVDSCRRTGDLGRWRYVRLEILGGYHFKHVAFEAVEFLRWYGPNAPIDQDPNYERAEQYLGVRDKDIPERNWRQFLSPKPLRRAEPPDSFEALASTHLRRSHWRHFRFERAELNKRIDDEGLPARAGWIGGFGTLHVPLLRESHTFSGRHIAIQVARQQRDSTETQSVPVAQEQGVRTIALIGASGVSIGSIGNLLAEALGWRWTPSSALEHRLAGRRRTLFERDAGGVLAEALERYAVKPDTDTILTIPIGSVSRHERSDTPTRLAEAELVLSDPRVLPIIVMPTRRTLELWEARQSMSTAGGYTTDNAAEVDRRTAMYETWLDFLRTVPGAFSTNVTATLPWAGPAVLGEDLEGAPTKTRSYLGEKTHGIGSLLGGASTDSAANPTVTPYFYQHPLIGDMLLRIAYELARNLRLRGGLATTRRNAPIPTPAATTRTAARPLGFARGSRIAQYESRLLAALGGPQWMDDEHLEWDRRYLSAATRESTPKSGRLTILTRVGPAWVEPAYEVAASTPTRV